MAMPSKKCRTPFFESIFFHWLVLELCRKPANEKKSFFLKCSATLFYLAFEEDFNLAMRRWP